MVSIRWQDGAGIHKLARWRWYPWAGKMALDVGLDGAGMHVLLRWQHHNFLCRSYPLRDNYLGFVLDDVVLDLAGCVSVVAPGEADGGGLNLCHAHLARRARQRWKTRRTFRENVNHPVLKKLKRKRNGLFPQTRKERKKYWHSLQIEYTVCMRKLYKKEANWILQTSIL